MNKDEIRAVSFGLGAIGRGVVRVASAKSGIRIVGCVDIQDDLVGKDAGEIAGLSEPLGVPVSASLRDLADDDANLAFHCTGSHLEDVRDALAEIGAAGMNIVSTCEELSFPRLRQPELAADIDGLAKEHGVTILGTGINPGFIMDTLPIVLTAMCTDVRRVHVTRIVDVATRRRQLQAKVGTGITLEEFEQRATTGRMGHIGLRESLLGIAEALGWPADDLHHRLEPIIADAPLETEFFDVAVGHVAGLTERTWIEHNGEEIIVLDLEMSVGANDPRDTVELDGTPPVSARVDGVQGDISTQAVVVNCAPRVVDAPPGLLSMHDIPPAYLAPPKRQC